MDSNIHFSVLMGKHIQKFIDYPKNQKVSQKVWQNARMLATFTVSCCQAINKVIAYCLLLN